MGYWKTQFFFLNSQVHSQKLVEMKHDKDLPSSYCLVVACLWRESLLHSETLKSTGVEQAPPMSRTQTFPLSFRRTTSFCYHSSHADPKRSLFMKIQAATRRFFTNPIFFFFFEVRWLRDSLCLAMYEQCNTIFYCWPRKFHGMNAKARALVQKQSGNFPVSDTAPVCAVQVCFLVYKRCKNKSLIFCRTHSLRGEMKDVALIESHEVTLARKAALQEERVWKLHKKKKSYPRRQDWCKSTRDLRLTALLPQLCKIRPGFVGEILKKSSFTWSRVHSLQVPPHLPVVSLTAKRDCVLTDDNTGEPFITFHFYWTFSAKADYNLASGCTHRLQPWEINTFWNPHTSGEGFGSGWSLQLETLQQCNSHSQQQYGARGSLVPKNCQWRICERYCVESDPSYSSSSQCYRNTKGHWRLLYL